MLDNNIKQQLEYSLLNFYFNEKILPNNKKNILKNKQIGIIILDVIDKELGGDWNKYYEILYNVVLKYLKNKKTKGAKILLDEIKKQENKEQLINIWQKNKINSKLKNKLENRVYILADKLVAKMLKSHLNEADKVQESFYNLYYFIYTL